MWLRRKMVVLVTKADRGAAARPPERLKGVVGAKQGAGPFVQSGASNDKNFARAPGEMGSPPRIPRPPDGSETGRESTRAFVSLVTLTDDFCAWAGKTIRCIKTLAKTGEQCSFPSKLHGPLPRRTGARKFVEFPFAKNSPGVSDLRDAYEIPPGG